MGNLCESFRVCDLAAERNSFSVRDGCGSKVHMQRLKKDARLLFVWHMMWRFGSSKAMIQRSPSSVRFSMTAPENPAVLENC